MLEVLSTVFGLIQGVLVMLDKRSNWIFYSLQMLFLLLFSINVHLWGDVAFDSIYFFIGIVGYFLWRPGIRAAAISGLDLSMYSADEIKEAMNSAIDAGGMDGHNSNYGHDIAFGAAYDVDARNMAKSTLLSKLSTNHIYTSNLYTDKLWGGLDSYSGDKVYDAINSARDSNKISDSVYRELTALLKKVCHSQ